MLFVMCSWFVNFYIKKVMVEKGLQHFCFCISGIENLPCELQRNFQLMRELDQRTEGMFRYSGSQIFLCAHIILDLHTSEIHLSYIFTGKVRSSP